MRCLNKIRNDKPEKHEREEGTCYVARLKRSSRAAPMSCGTLIRSETKRPKEQRIEEGNPGFAAVYHARECNKRTGMRELNRI